MDLRVEESTLRKLATIAKIDQILPHPQADRLELAKVRCWQVVIKKGEFNEGDLCVYCEIDSLMPERPEFEFLRDRKFLIKTIRLRGELSQGICFHLSILPMGEAHLEPLEGDDVTEALGIQLHQPPIPACLSGDVNGVFPSFIPKTDCERIQNHSWILDELAELEWVATEKLDGSSCTVLWDEQEGLQVCSRNWNMRRSDRNAYWQAAMALGLDEKLKGSRVAWQGELIGPKIQGNRYNAKEYTIYFFDAYHLDEMRYLGFSEYRHWVTKMEFPRVPIVHGKAPLPKSMDELLQRAEGKSVLNFNAEREGLVWKLMEDRYDPRIGRCVFKTISNRFLLQQKD